MSEVRVTFQPMRQSVYVLPGTSLLEAAGMAGIILQSPCGGLGTCGKCRIKVISGECASKETGDEALPRDLAEKGFRLACLTSIGGDLVVEVPQESTFESRHQILIRDAGAESAVKPVIAKKHFQLDPPTIEDDRSDQTRLLDVIGDLTIPTYLTRRLPGFMRKHAWQGTAVSSGRRMIALEPGDTSDEALGVAFDIGTTTVVGTLFDVLGGRELAVVSKMNSQIGLGDDVISRILKVRENPVALTQLQEAILETANDIITGLCDQSGVSYEHIYEIAIAGNATMQQIFCGFDPSALGEMPFVQVFDRAQKLPASRLGLKTNVGADVFVMPQIGGFVGGDTVAGMVATRIDRWEQPVLLVDIGTNGEIVLCHDGTLLAVSAAAGPAFEGARITQGMRATAGAIEKVIIDDNVLLNVIGNTKPAGICGTALIDAAAGMLRKGVLDSTGRILEVEDLPFAVSGQLQSRLVKNGDNVDFLLARGEETASGNPIYIYQKDIRELQLATGAIRAAINILLRRSGLDADELGVVLLAGAFGNFIRRSNARRIGLLPQIPCERIRFIGNAASLGAKLALLSADEREYADKLRHRVEHVDLSLDAEFQTEFGMAMLFPEADGDACGGE